MGGITLNHQVEPNLLELLGNYCHNFGYCIEEVMLIWIYGAFSSN